MKLKYEETQKVEAEVSRCPGCNLFLIGFNNAGGTEFWIECNNKKCGMKGPFRLSAAQALEAWNDLPRRPMPVGHTYHNGDEKYVCKFCGKKGAIFDELWKPHDHNVSWSMFGCLEECSRIAFLYKISAESEYEYLLWYEGDGPKPDCLREVKGG